MIRAKEYRMARRKVSPSTVSQEERSKGASAVSEDRE